MRLYPVRRVDETRPDRVRCFRNYATHDVWVLAKHGQTTALDDASLLACNGLERIPQICLVIEIDGGNGDGHGFHGVRGIEAAAESDLEYRSVHEHATEDVE